MSDGFGKAAIHRWDHVGEGWSFHSWFKPHFRELVVALDRELADRAAIYRNGPRKVEVAALGGVLWGEHVADEACPDPRAKSRSPTILRVVLLKTSPTADQSVELLSQLRNLTAENKGEVNSLKLAPPAERSVRSTSLARWGCFLVLLIVGACVGFGLWIGWGAIRESVAGLVAPQTSSPAADSELPALATEMGRWLDRRSGDSPNSWEKLASTEPTEVAAQLFKRLSLEGRELPVLPDDSKHPDVQFLRRLPESPLWTPDTKLALSDSLLDLRRRLTSQVENSEEARPAAETLEVVLKAADYEEWWRVVSSQFSPDAFDAKQDERISKAARSFSKRRAPDWQAEAATLLQEDLKRWKVGGLSDRGDSTIRPYLVFAAYLRLLSQDRLVRHAILTADASKCRSEYFLSFLPKDLTDEERVGILSKEQFLDSLNKRSERKHPEPTDDVAIAIDRVRDCLDYHRFLKETEGVRAKYPDKPSTKPAVNELIKRFETND